MREFLIDPKRDPEQEYTIHLFEFCNLRCNFCWQNHDNKIGVDNVVDKLPSIEKFVSKENSLDLITLQKTIAKNVSRSLTTIYSLQTSLDFEKGGKIATGLFQLYEYCRLQIISGFTNSINNGIIKAMNALDQIISAWNNMSVKTI